MERSRFIPHDYQSRAIRFVEEHPRCALFLEMGLGKTVVMLTAIQRLIDECEIRRALVIAPKKVAESTWADEAAKWRHLCLRTIYIGGTAAERSRAMRADADIHVVSRDNVAWLFANCGKPLPWDMIVIDELTSFKNPAAIRFKSLRAVLPLIPRVVGLTGTPTPNGLYDLWAQIYCIDQGERLGRFVTHYRREYFNTVEHNHIVIKMWPKEGAEARIMEKISDISLTMRASDWLTLPGIIYEDVTVKLPAVVKARYDRFEKDQVMELKASAGSLREITAASAAALIGKLSQFANGAVYDEERNVIPVHDEKLERLGEILEGAGGPVLCFYQYVHDLERIRDRFAKKLRVRVYGGKKDLDDWNARKIDLMLAHPASTAFGINMQRGGSVIVWFSTGWNLELYQQANARLHRQGQEHVVRVFNLIAAGTVDERMAEALTGKSRNQESFVRSLAQGLVRIIGK